MYRIGVGQQPRTINMVKIARLAIIICTHIDKTHGGGGRSQMLRIAIKFQCFLTSAMCRQNDPCLLIVVPLPQI